jgi:Zinc-finger double-stranded RNA-binding
MNADTIIKAVQTELGRHSFDTFVSNPPSIAQGGRGVVVSGCPACKKQFQSLNQFVTHLSEDVLPVTIREACAL